MMLVHDTQGIDEVELFSGAPHLQSLLSTLADYLIPQGSHEEAKHPSPPPQFYT